MTEQNQASTVDLNKLAEQLNAIQETIQSFAPVANYVQSMAQRQAQEEARSRLKKVWGDKYEQRVERVQGYLRQQLEAGLITEEDIAELDTVNGFRSLLAEVGDVDESSGETEATPQPFNQPPTYVKGQEAGKGKQPLFRQSDLADPNKYRELLTERYHGDEVAFEADVERAYGQNMVDLDITPRRTG